MLFDEAPKKRRSDFFDFEKELSSFVSSIKEGARLVTISGLRRTGKSSLMLTGLSQIGQPSLVIDARQFAQVPVISRSDLVRALEDTLNEFMAREKRWANRIKDAIKSVKGVEVSTGSPPTISLAWGSHRNTRNSTDLARVFKTLGQVAEDNHSRFVIAFDEAQEFRRLAGYDLSKLIAHVYDYVPSIQIILTGSQFGFLYQFIGIDNPKASLYGRARVDIEIGRLTSAQSRDFLTKGMQQIGIVSDDNLLEIAIQKLDGIIGWLTYLGALTRRKGAFTEAIMFKAIEESTKLAASELETFLELHASAKKRYKAILARLSQTEKASWSEIKRSVQIEEGRTIPDNTFSALLANLVKASFLEKEQNGSYSIADPVLREALRSRST